MLAKCTDPVQSVVCNDIYTALARLEGNAAACRDLELLKSENRLESGPLWGSDRYKLSAGLAAEVYVTKVHARRRHGGRRRNDVQHRSERRGDDCGTLESAGA